MVLRIKRKLLQELSYLDGKYYCPPDFLSLMITFKCNFKCLSCAIWEKDSVELSKNDWLKIASGLKGSLPKSTFVEINGGEALIEKDLVLKIIMELKKYFDSVALNSNGSLINTQTISEIERAGLDILKISFYSLDSQTHNLLRGMPFAYDNALRAIKLAVTSKITPEVGILITDKNIEGIPALVNYLKALGEIDIILQPLDERLDLKEFKINNINRLIKSLWPKKSEVKKLFFWATDNSHLFKNSKENIEVIEKYYLKPSSILKYRCFAGQRNLVIYPNGDVVFCFKGSSIGNLTEKSVKVILKKAVDERKNIKNCRKYCRIVGCNFSRGIKEVIKEKVGIN
jgi:MoaA/NifB/PqqE/SkfB family radical SAM enzyme